MELIEADPGTRGEQDLADRAALRRVAGLSTELTDITEVEYRRLQLERVVLVGVWTDGTAADAEASMAELSRLAETAGSVVLDALCSGGGTRTPAPTSGPARSSSWPRSSRPPAPTR